MRTLTLSSHDACRHQWIFITDTVDAVFPPDGWTPQAVLDRLGEVVNERKRKASLVASATTPRPSTPSTPRKRTVTLPNHTPSPSTGSIATVTAATTTTGGRAGGSRRPMLNEVRQGSIKSLDELERFFARISLSAYESVYASSIVDFEALESSIDADLFEG